MLLACGQFSGPLKKVMSKSKISLFLWWIKCVFNNNNNSLFRFHIQIFSLVSLPHVSCGTFLRERGRL